MRWSSVPLFLLCLATGCGEPAQPAPSPRSPSSPSPTAAPQGTRVQSGRIYVPIYSHIYSKMGATEDLAVTVSVRNVSVEHQVVLESVRYYDTAGKLLEEFVETPSTLQPLETVEFFIPREDTRGGSGANLVVTWGAATPVTAPLVEAVMLQSGKTNRAFAFATRGVEVSREGTLPSEVAERKPEPPAEAPDEAVE